MSYTAMSSTTDLIKWESRQFFLEASPTRLFVTWKLREFSTTPTDPGDIVESEIFKFRNSTWILRFFPQGCTESSARELYLCLVRLSSGTPNQDVMFKLFYKNRLGQEYLSREDNPFSKFDGVGFDTSIKRRDLYGDLREHLLVDDTLVICCELRDPGQDGPAVQPDAFPDASDETEFFSSDHRKLLADISAVYEETPFPDVTIKVGGKQFPAHKAILSMRSSVFRGIFEADMQDRLADLRQMEEQTFRQMLQYIYTCRVRDLTVESAKSLYVVADEYDLPGLKDRCRRYLLRDMSVDNVCEMALLSDRHSDEELETAVKLFLCKNHQRVLKSETWRRTAAEHPAFFWELIASVVEEMGAASGHSQ